MEKLKKNNTHTKKTKKQKHSAVYQLSSVTGLPALLPDLLKEFAKAAIRTQPADLLSWSRDYFRARAADVAPPEKERWEPPPARPGVGVTAGLLRLLHRQVTTEPPYNTSPKSLKLNLT